MDMKCLGTNRDGSPCSATPRASGFCLWHDEALAGERQGWRAKGGSARSNAARAEKAMPAAMTTHDLLVTLSRAIQRVEDGTMEPGPANAIASLAKVISALHEASIMESRVAALEERSATFGARGRMA